MRTRLLAPLALAATVALTGCATEPVDGELNATSGAPEPFDGGFAEETATQDDATTDGAALQTAVTGSIVAEDQTGDGGSVLVDEVSVTGTDGWVVVHADSEGSPGAVLGTAALTSSLEEKRETDLRVDLGAPLDAGEHAVWIMLHRDDGVVGSYEFPGPDEPIVVNGEIVMVSVTVTVT